MENANQIFSHLWAIYHSKSPLTVPNTLNKVILGSFGTRRLTTASFSHFYQLPKTSPPYIVDSLKNLLLMDGPLGTCHIGLTQHEPTDKVEVVKAGVLTPLTAV